MGNNIAIKYLLKKYRITRDELAEYTGYQKSTLKVMLCRPMSAYQKDVIKQAIEKIVREKGRE